MNSLAEIEVLCLRYKEIIPSKNIQAHQVLDEILGVIQGAFIEEDKSLLTRRETEIMTYVMKGFTNREIASALNISSKTIEFHLSNIYLKTQTSGRAEAISYILSQNWIQP